jgi:dTDP-glucose 4,6-dehydratase
MRLLVTGGAGFIGSHFIRSWRAAHPADEVVNLDCLSYAGSRERVSDLEQQPAYRFIQGDICDPELVRQAIGGCRMVVHFAAETHVDRSITNAAPFLRTNVEGTQILLEAARERGVERFIHVSTDEVYGEILDGAVDEQARLAPRSPYAASKAAGDLLAQAHHATHGLPTIVVRPTNIFGPAQLPEKFIPLCIANATDALPVPLYGDGTQRRAWLFVEDLCSALRVVIERGEVGAVYNVASGHEQANLDTARQILSLLDRPRDLIRFVEDRPGHDRRYGMNDAKLRAMGWRPTTAFDQGLSQTVRWYLQHAAWWRPLTQRLREDPYHWLDRTSGSGPRPAARVVL